MFAPRGTPADRIEKVAAAVSKALADPAVIQALERTGTEVWSTSSPAEFATFLTEERARYGKLIETIGIAKH
jgi:tripartite-type tricarboxylate transporter receptor subunit TctC